MTLDYPRVGIGVLIIRDGQVLLGRRMGSHGAGSYGGCGGHLEYGETLEACARREVYEETALRVVNLRFLCLANIRDYDRHYVDVEFLAEVLEGEPYVREPHRVEGWGWYRLDALPMPLFRAAELALISYVSGSAFHSEEPPGSGARLG
jgi:8-oxo-dGTP diphosphatase